LASKSNHGEAQFQLSPALPSATWAELTGFAAGDCDHASVDAALLRLAGATTAEDRFEILRRLVEYWHGPVEAEDGMKQEELSGFQLPLPLLWWYRWAGNRKEIMSGQNHLLLPKELQVVDNRLLFYVENQGVYHWATMPEGNDPPVFGRYSDCDSWQLEGIRLSEHLILACLFEAIVCHSSYGASTAWLEKDKFSEIVQHIPPLSVEGWRWPGRMRFYAGCGAFMCASSNEDRNKIEHSIWIGAKTEKPLQFLKPYLDTDWEYVAV
jgi:hypothetical protein